MSLMYLIQCILVVRLYNTLNNFIEGTMWYFMPAVLYWCQESVLISYLRFSDAECSIYSSQKGIFLNSGQFTGPHFLHEGEKKVYNTYM